MPLFGGLARRTPFYYGWVVAGAVSLTMLSSGALAAPMFSVFIPAWVDEFGWSLTAISGAFSFGTIVAALAGPAVGRMLDRYGGRLVMGGGALAMAAALGGLALAGSLAGLYAALAVGRTALMGIQNLGGHTVIANWFVRRRALATALAVNGSRLGLGAWPLLAAALIASVGWRTTLWTLAAAVALLAIVPLVFIVARRPEELGLHPDGAPRQRGRSRDATQGEARWRPREAARTAPFWLLMAAHMGAMFAGGGFGVHRIPFFLERGLAGEWVGPVLLVHALGMLIGGFAAAWLMSVMPRRAVIFLVMAAAAGAMWAALVVPPDIWVAAYTFVESMAFGGVFAMLPVVYADYFGRESIGMIRGITHPIVVGANAAGPLFAGAVYDASDGSYTIALVSFGAVLGVGAVCALLARPPAATAHSS